jgi:hypothetical protein
MATIGARFQCYGKTASAWTSANPVPLVREVCLETDTGRIKFGDGVTAWNSLPYYASGYTVATRSASYAETATSGDVVNLITGVAVNVTLPSAVGNKARLTFKLTVAGTLTLTASGGQSIDGGATAATSIQYTAITIVSDGANWQVI